MRGTPSDHPHPPRRLRSSSAGRKDPRPTPVHPEPRPRGPARPSDPPSPSTWRWGKGEGSASHHPPGRRPTPANAASRRTARQHPRHHPSAHPEPVEGRPCPIALRTPPSILSLSKGDGAPVARAAPAHPEPIDACPEPRPRGPARPSDPPSPSTWRWGGGKGEGSASRHPPGRRPTPANAASRRTARQHIPHHPPLILSLSNDHPCPPPPRPPHTPPMTHRPSLLDDRRVLPISLGANWIYALPAADPARDGVLLIDAGPDYDGAWEALVTQLHVAGLDPSQVRTVLITHAHLDHCGLARRWQQQGAKLAGSADEVPRFLLGDRVVRYQADLVFRFMLEAGVPAGKLEQIIRRRRGRPASPPRPESPRSARRPPATLPRALARRPPRRPLPARPATSPTGTKSSSATAGCASSPPPATPPATPSTSKTRTTAPAHHSSAATNSCPTSPPTPACTFTARRSAFAACPPTPAPWSASQPWARGTSTPATASPATAASKTPSTAPSATTPRRQQRVLRFLRDGPLSPYQVLAKFFPHLPDARLWQAFAEVIGHIDALVERAEVVEELSDDGSLRVRRAGLDQP